MAEQLNLDHGLIQQWVNNSMDEPSISAQLNQSGMSPDITELYLQAFRKFKDEKRYKTGITLIISGAILGFISCVASLCNIAPEYCTLILVGLTSVSLMLVFSGLYLVFEK